MAGDRVKFSPRNQAVAGAVVIIVAVVAAVVLLANRGDQLTANAKTIIINQLIISVPTLIAAIFALVKQQEAKNAADEAKTAAEEMRHDLQNGLIPEKVEEAITKMADDPEIGIVTIENNGKSCTCPKSDDVTPEMRTETGQHLTGCPLARQIEVN